MTEIEDLEQQIVFQNNMITHLSDRLDKLTIRHDKIRGVLKEIDRGEKTKDLAVDYIRMHMEG